MNIFVTGGAGFIGSHLVDQLIQDGHAVTVYDDLSSGKQEFIEHHLDNNNFTFIHADLVDTKKLIESLQGHDVVYHIAANPDVRLGAQQPVIAKKDMLAIYNLLDTMRRHDIKQIIFSSSSTVYGETPPQPLPENYGPLLPISVYGAAKLAAEGMISSFCHTFDMQGWIFRFANIVGERGTHGVIVDFIKKLRNDPKHLEILGDGKQKKPYLYVKDCVDAMLFGCQHAQDQINVLNLGCDTATQVTRIAEIVVEEMGLNDVTFSYTGGTRGWKGDVPYFQLDTTKMKKLGWTATYLSDDAVRETTKVLLDTNL
ncbi:MAG: NAD-dependent epimerase/dehydratase family protein [Candidatus Thermoplasmatota archaeon]|nr:NAD-dependent epimerase/dehydratase family protein [Candidatus Thermoplasmatota archaeon]